jgi:hypothetical protein
MPLPTKPIGSIPRPPEPRDAPATFERARCELDASKGDVTLAGEPDRARVLKLIRAHGKPDRRGFVGGAPFDARVEAPAGVRDGVLGTALSSAAIGVG